MMQDEDGNVIWPHLDRVLQVRCAIEKLEDAIHRCVDTYDEQVVGIALRALADAYRLETKW